MAIYSCHISNVSRAKGSCSCATLSYITGSKVYCERLGQTFSYGRKERVEHVETLLPVNAPAEFKDPAVLFNAIENYEKASNARTAKKIMVALPVEFSRDKQKEVIREFCSNLTKEGYACSFAIHCDKEEKNPHAHILVANRAINKNGEFANKRKKEYVLDDNGERVPIIDKETGLQKIDKRNRKQWKRIDAEINPLDKKIMLENLRTSWANVCNKNLEPTKQISEKSHKERGIELKPTIHEGYNYHRAEINRQIRADNTLLIQVTSKLKQVQGQLQMLLNKPKKRKKQYIHAGNRAYLKRRNHLLEFEKSKRNLKQNNIITKPSTQEERRAVLESKKLSPSASIDLHTKKVAEKKGRFNIPDPAESIAQARAEVEEYNAKLKNRGKLNQRRRR